MDIYVDATTLIALGSVGRLELLSNFDGDVVIPPEVRAEVTTEPARTNTRSLLRADSVYSQGGASPSSSHCQDARELLGEGETNGDVRIITELLRRLERDDRVAVVSDDRRVRTVADGLGATVTGTVGVIVRAVHEGMDPEEAKDLVRRLDSHGLHMTGELRETASRLIEAAADDRDDEHVA